MGRSLSSEKSPGDLVQAIQDLSYKLSRSYGSAPYLKESLPASLDPHKIGDRQQGGCEMLESTRIEVTTSQPGDVGHLPIGGKEEVVPVGSSPSRSPQCDSGRSIQVHTDRVGMVLRRRIILLHSESVPELQIDLFATKDNKKLPLYVPRTRTP